MSDRTVVVTGLGAVSSIGNDLASTWASLVAGRSGIGPITLFDASGFRTKLAAEIRAMPDPGVSPRMLRRLSRTDVIGLTAAREALADSGLELDREDPARIGHLAHLGRDLRPEAARVEEGDGADPAPAGDEAGPGRGEVVSQGADGAEAGDDDGPVGHGENRTRAAPPRPDPGDRIISGWANASTGTATS